MNNQANRAGLGSYPFLVPTSWPWLRVLLFNQLDNPVHVMQHGINPCGHRKCWTRPNNCLP